MASYLIFTARLEARQEWQGANEGPEKLSFLVHTAREARSLDPSGQR
jgi:hypothetical protein